MSVIFVVNTHPPITHSLNKIMIFCILIKLSLLPFTKILHKFIKILMLTKWLVFCFVFYYFTQSNKNVKLLKLTEDFCLHSGKYSKFCLPESVNINLKNYIAIFAALILCGPI